MAETGHIDPTKQSFRAFKALNRDLPIDMLNLVRFRQTALYPASHELAEMGLTGARAYARYSEASNPIFVRVGGEVIWSGMPQTILIGPETEHWDTAFVARYPSAHAFLEMVTDAQYRIAVIHRQAAVFDSRLVRMTETMLSRTVAGVASPTPATSLVD
jgi:uncharacterized protein (DUF1330 family)